MFKKITSSFTISILMICLVTIISYFLTPNPPENDELKVISDKSALIGKN